MSEQGDLQVQAMQRQAIERLEMVKGVGAELEKVRGVAQTADRSVSVTVNPAGVPIKIALTDEACQLGPQRLAAVLLETIGKAGQHAAAAAHDVTAPLRDQGADTDAMREGRMPASVTENIDEELARLREGLGIRTEGVDS